MDANFQAVNNLRRLIVSTIEKANSGHPGGALGGADFIHILFSEFLEYNPSDLSWDLRDRFFLDPGHMSAMFYSVLTLLGILKIDDLKNFRQWESITAGHPERNLNFGIENTSGPLGQGHAMAVGAAIAEKFLAARFGEIISHKIYAFISDGGVQEEISLGAARIAGHLGLNNLIMYYDSNNIQLSSKTSDVTSENVASRYKAFGWEVFKIDGHDHDEIRGALKEANKSESRPVLIIGNTKMAKGAVDENGKSLEGSLSTHGSPLGPMATVKTILALGGDPENRFSIDKEVAKLYEKRKSELNTIVKKKEEKRKTWASKNSALSIKYKKFISLDISSLDLSSISIKPNLATRAMSGDVLQFLYDKIENLIVMSADLANSDKTDAFLKKTRIFKKGNFEGSFLQIGVSELTMAAIMNGMAAHGGVIPIGGTFFVFSDYMKPAVRLAALQGLPIKIIWSHDSFRVGEDGPTHQPIEQEAQIRLLEEIKNEHGEKCIEIFRPADSAETVHAWNIALRNSKTPTALIITRQNLKDLPGSGGMPRIECAKDIEKGAYIISGQGIVDLILVASGSEVSLCEDAAEMLRRDKGIKVRVVSVPSSGLFLSQGKNYQDSVLPKFVPTFGVTVSTQDVLLKLVGPFGKVYSMTRFGASAPYKTLDEKFGYTPQNISKLAFKYYTEVKMEVEEFYKKFKRL